MPQMVTALPELKRNPLNSKKKISQENTGIQSEDEDSL